MVRSGDGLSDEFRTRTQHELDALRARLREIDEEAERTRAALSDLDADAASCRSLIGELESLLGLASQLDLPLESTELRGRRIHEVAIELLRNEVGEGEPVSYRAWFDLLTRAGFRIVAKNPQAAFLTQISRAPGVEPVGRRSGLYRLVPAN